MVLAAVFALHAGALALLLAEMRTRLIRGDAAASPLSVWLLEPRKRPDSATPPQRAPRAGAAAPAPAPIPEGVPPSSTAPVVPGAIDWRAEAASAASRATQASADRTRQAQALAPKVSPMFKVRPRPREFPWDYASTHRIEPAGGLATIVHVNDQCAVAFFLIIPFAAGCSLEKPQVRGDLFEHMHDPAPLPPP